MGVANKTFPRKYAIEPDFECSLSPKMKFIYEKIARLTMSNVRDDEIARLCGYKSKVSVTQIRATQEYGIIFDALKANVLSVFDENLANDTAALQETVRQQVPQALKKLVEALNSRNEKISIDAAKELIAMDGRVAKVQRLGLPSDAQGGIGDVDSSIADEILIAMGKKKDAN